MWLHSCFPVPEVLPTVTLALSLPKQFLVAFAKLWRAPVSFVVCLCPRGRTPLPPGGFSWSIIYEDISKIHPGNSSLNEIWWELQYFTGRHI